MAKKAKTFRQKLIDFCEHPYFFGFITTVILINAVTLGLDTSETMVAKYGPTLHLLDEIALSIFVVEILIKLYAFRLSFFKKGWYVFDFIIVAISLIPAVGPLSVLRALRVLRVLRLVSVVPEMRRVITALLSAIPGMASIMAVIGIIFYVSAVLATKLFGGHPLPEIAERFDDLGASLYTLFQIMTLEGWSDDIVRPVMEVYPLAWLFFIPFIIVASFAVLNLFIGVIVDAIGIMNEEEDKKEIRAIQKDLRDIKKILKTK
ncbi:MAG: ion transporter [Pseudomonadota bacterium]